jgi:hypothetical protein
VNNQTLHNLHINPNAVILPEPKARNAGLTLGLSPKLHPMIRRVADRSTTRQNLQGIRASVRRTAVIVQSWPVGTKRAL